VNDALMKVLNDGIERRLHTGGQVVVLKAGREVCALAFGSNGSEEAMTLEHTLPLLSAGKPITAAAVMKLWEQGEISIDDVVAKYVPAFGQMGKEGITIRDCLLHTAGLRGVAVKWWEPSVGEIVDQVCAAELESNWEVGKTAGYHIGSTWFVLGEIVRRVMGTDLRLALRGLVLDAAGMKETTIGMGAGGYEGLDRAGKLGRMYDTLAISAATAHGHESESGAGRLQTWEKAESFVEARCPANARGTARDLARFYQALLDGNYRLLRPTTAAAMTARHRVNTMDLTFRAKVDTGLGVICNSAYYGQPTLPYGFGEGASMRAFGHGGNMSSLGMADPDRELVVAVMFNGQPGEPRHQARMNELMATIYREF
jgi:CubicO group peptidase (beta-lactamase class C family)